MESVYLRGATEIALEPYFTEEDSKQPYDLVFAFIGLHVNMSIQPKEYHYRPVYYTNIMIIRNNDDIYSFLQPRLSSESANITPILVDTHEYSSSHFLTKDQVVTYYEKNEYKYHFNLAKVSNEFCFSFFRYTGNDYRTASSYDFSIDQSSLRILDIDEVISLIEETTVEKIYDIATVMEVDFDKKVLTVESNTYSSLETISYDYLYMSNGDIYLGQNLVNKQIEYYFYKRFDAYSPVNISCKEVYLK